MIPKRVQALDWVKRIRNHKPRYIRDQIQSLKTTVTGLETNIASEGLDYACANDNVSASDFSAVVESLKRKRQNAVQCASKVTSLNPLSGNSRRIADTDPERSDLGSYDNFITI